MDKLNKFPFPDALYDTEDYFIAGGAVLSHIMGTDIADYDVYPKSKEAAKHIVETLYGNTEFVGVTSRAITFISYQVNREGRRIPIQVMPFDEFTTAEKIFSTFDFTVCMVAVDDKGNFYKDDRTFLDLAARKITYNTNSLFPLASLLRLGKYAKKGFSVPKSTTAVIAFCAAAKGMPTSWEEAEGLIGGYYGRGITIKREENVPFNLEALCDAVVDIGDYSPPPPSKSASLDSLLYSIDPKPIPHIKLAGTTIEYKEGGVLGRVLSFAPFAQGEAHVPELIRSYKYAVELGGTIRSQYNSHFFYKLGEVVKFPHSPWLFSSKVIPAYKKTNGVLLEVYCLPENVKRYSYDIQNAILQSDRLYVSRVVPEEEIELLKNKELVTSVPITPAHAHIVKALKDSMNEPNTSGGPSVGWSPNPFSPPAAVTFG